MDPICHTLVGASLSQTGLGRKTAGGAAALIIGANLPDVDGVAMFIDQDTALWIRRGWTHGVPALVLLPLLLTAFVVLWRCAVSRDASGPPLRPWVLLGLSYLSVLTHPTLDWMNQYGMRWLMPIDGTWFYGDTLFIVDPWMWLVLGGAVFLRTSRRLSSGLGWLAFAAFAGFLLTSVPGLVAAKALWLGAVVALAAMRFAGLGREEAPARRIATTAVAAATLYVLGMGAVGQIARAKVLADLEARGVRVERLMVAAVAVTPFRKEVVVETNDGYRVGAASLLPRFELDLAPESFPLPDAIVEEALRAPSVRGFANWARFPFGEVEKEAGQYVVYLIDARYASRRSSGFGTARVTLPASTDGR